MMVEEVLGPIVVSYEKTGGDRKEWDYGGGPKGKNKERQTRKKTVHKLICTAHLIVVPM